MDQKHIGIILLILSIGSGIITYSNYNQEQRTLDVMLSETGTCFLDDGTCIHSKINMTLLVSSLISLALFILGLYLLIFDKTQRLLHEQHLQVSSALEKAKKHDKEKDNFGSFLEAFNEDEQKILKVVKEQEGIKQSTLQYKTNLSKTKLSLLLTELENRKVIARKIAGKTKKVFIRK